MRKNPFIGLYFRANDDFLFAPRTMTAKLEAAAEAALEVPIIKASVNQSELLGLFAAMNKTGCVLPSFAEDDEVAVFRKAGLNVLQISSHYACGNNILCNDKAALVHYAMPKNEIKRIADTLGVEVFPHESLSRIQTVGAANVVTNKGLVAYNDITDVELRKLEKVFGVQGQNATCNMGVPYVGIGIVANSKGALVGEMTSGFEVQRIYESLFG